MARLAELMVHITECSPAVAIGAVGRAAGDEPVSNDNAIDILARAISSVQSGIDLRDSVNLRQEIQQLATVRLSE